MKSSTGVTLALPLHTAPENGVPLYRQIYRRVREDVLAGRLAPGTRLPSARVLAADLHLSRNTVEPAFSQLETEGFSRDGWGLAPS